MIGRRPSWQHGSQRSQAAPVVVVTGASAGVGRAVARRFARDGAKVGLVARGAAGLAGAAREVEEAGGIPLVLQADVADADAVEWAAERAELELGPIDVWVNCAMATIFGPVQDASADEFRRATEVTYLGFVHGTQSALRRMRPRDRGTIVQVGSALAYRAIPLQAAYCGAKFATRGFTNSVRTELLYDRSRVHVTMVHLPAINTPQFDWGRNHMSRRPQPVKPIFQPEVAAEGVWWAARRRKREVWVGEPTLRAILGERVMPWLLDRYLARTAWDGQQAQAPVPKDPPDNLFSPADEHEDFGTHGRFDDDSRDHSIQMRLSRHRLALSLAALGAASTGALVRARSR